MMAVKEHGFTLVEVLAALLIFSVSIMALMRAGAQNAKAVYIIEQKILASIIADNQMALARLQYRFADPQNIPASRTGKSTQNGQDYTWNSIRFPTDLIGFYRLEITVKPDGQDQVLVKRTGFAARSTAIRDDVGDAK